MCWSKFLILDLYLYTYNIYNCLSKLSSFDLLIQKLIYWSRSWYSDLFVDLIIFFISWYISWSVDLIFGLLMYFLVYWYISGSVALTSVDLSFFLFVLTFNMSTLFWPTFPILVALEHLYFYPNFDLLI